MERVQILLLVAFFYLVNIAQMADEILLMVCLLSRHQYLRNQVALLTIEYCRRQRRRARRQNPYFWKLPIPNQSWFEIHYNDRRIPGIISKSNYEWTDVPLIFCWTPCDRCHSGFGPPVNLDPRSISASGFGPPRSKSASGYGPPFADLDPPTKLSF